MLQPSIQGKEILTSIESLEIILKISWIQKMEKEAPKILTREKLSVFIAKNLVT